MPGDGGQTPLRGPASADNAETKRLLRSAGTVGGLTLVSRVLGLARDIVVGALLGGATPVSDAWHAAFQIPNILRRLVGEGNFSAAFIPVFSRVARGPDEASVRALVQRFFTGVLIAASLLTLIGMATSSWLTRFLFAGYGAVPGKIQLTASLTRAVFPYLLFIALSAALMAALNARDRFAAPAFTPVLLNVSFLGFGAAAYFLGAAQPVWWIAVGGVVGGLAQFLFLVRPATRAGMPLRLRSPFGNPAVREIARLMVPGLFAVGIVQINIFVGRRLASDLGDGAVTSLYQASRLNELALGVFAVSVATVVLPLMSRQGAAGRLGALRNTYSFAVRQVCLVTVPATVGLVVLRSEIVAALFERGAWDARATGLTASALWAFALGLTAVALVRVTAPAFFALRDTRTPVKVAAVGMIVNIVACLALRDVLANAGIALANSLAAAVNATGLMWMLRRRIGRIGGGIILASIARIVAAAAVMAWVVDALRRTVLVGLESTWMLLPGVTFAILVGTLTYGAALILLRAPELVELRTVAPGRGSSGTEED